MKRLGKLKLTQLSKVELEKNRMNRILGGGDGTPCGCTCWGSSSTYSNGTSNSSNGYGGSGDGNGNCFCVCGGSEIVTNGGDAAAF